MIEIRAFGENDYPALASIFQSHHPERPFSAATWRRFDENTAPKFKLMRWVGMVDGQVVGYCQMNHDMGSFDPAEFWVNVMVHPDHLRKGYGAALYDHLMAHVSNANPARLKATIKEDNADSVAFAARHGYEEYARRFDSVLDLHDTDISPFVSALDKASSHGIRFKTCAELESEQDFDYKLYELHQVTRHDIPFADPIKEEQSLQEFRERYLNIPGLLKDGSFVALYGDEYVGVTTQMEPASSRVYVDYTGVLREHRRKGIATALKVLSIQYARDHGYESMITTNDTANQAILNLNTAMGFVRLPARVMMVKQL